MKALKACCLLAILLLFTAPLLFAEGSKELNQSGGYRAYINSSTTASSLNPYPTLGTVKVYVNVGERIYLGSSAQGIGSGTINLRAPNGQTYTSGSSTLTGRISSRSQEVVGPSVALLDGGYTPFIVTVGAGQAGVWEIDFVPPNASNNTNPTAVLSSSAWSQPTGTCYIAAFDVSVRNSSNTFVPGRVFTNIFSAHLGSPAAPFNPIFHILTQDGYMYTVNNNGQAGYGFVFLVNNKGFRLSNGNPSYKSIDDLTSPNLKDPRTADTETDITHKIFFNTPATDLPANAPSVSGSIWLLNTPPTLAVSNISFVGVEGSAGIAGTNPAGGYVRFTATNATNYGVDIDINNNGSYADAVDKRLTGTAVVGVNNAYWDGTNGQGVKVLSGSNNYNTRVILFSGEVHFPFIDVENNPNGIIITRTNGSGAGNNTVYWDDSNIASTGTPSNPLVNTTGLSSATNGHKWGSTSYSGTDFGNENGLDTWAYLQSTPTATALAIQLREADLETVSIAKTPATLCQGQPITYTVTVRNNGPNNVTGAAYRFTFPAELTGVGVTSAVTSGTASVTGGTTSGNQYNATLNMNNAAVVTFTITGTVSAFPGGGSLSVTSSVMRPTDVTDPDATNPDAAAPTDPQVECDAAPSGVGCNNIKTDVTTISQTPTTANAGPAQVLCAATSATLAANTPTVGTGTWTKVSGAGTQAFANAAVANTTVSGLTAGVYVFRWTISNGACTASTSDVQITVQAALSGNTITAPATAVFCGSGDPAAITGATPTGGSGSYTYQWQQSTDNTNFTDITGATSAAYDPPAISATTYYRRLVTSGSCTTASVSNVVTISIQPAVTGNTILAPATTTFCGSGDAAVITGATPAGGNGAFTYQWQSSTDNSTWTNLSGATGLSYDPSQAVSTMYFRRLVTSGTCTNASISNVVTITVTPVLTAGAVAGNQDFCISGDPAAFTETGPATGGGGTYTYQWQSSVTSASTGFTDIGGATAAVYNAPVLSQTTWYRRITRSGVCTDAISNVITVTINPTLTAGSIAASQSFCSSGDPAAFTVSTVPTGGTGSYTYQWQSSVTSASAGFTDISGATAAVYDAGALSQTTWFRRIVRSGACADAISNAVTVTVLAGISNNTISSAQTICSGSTPAALTGTAPSGASGTYTYLWESSTGGGSFAAAAGTNNGQNYTPPSLTQSTSYRRTVISGGCGNSISNIIQVTVTPPASTANAGADQGPLNLREVQLNGNTPVNGTAAWTQVSGPNTAGIVNPALATTSVTGLVPGTYVFRWTISNPPCTSSTDDVQIIVNAPPVAVNDAITTNEDQPVNISVLANDTDSDGSLNTGSITLTSQPANGTVTISPAGVITYTPAADYNGADVFSYTVRDNLGAVSNTATVSLTITPVNDAPVAAPDVINVLEDVTTNIPPPGILGNDFDVDGGQLTVVLVTPPSAGTLVLNGDGSLSFTPPQDFTGNLTFTYRVCDAAGTCDTASVTIEVGNENDAPVANNDTYTVNEDAVLNVPVAGVLSNDTDADNDPLTASVITAPASGTLALNPDGSFSYTPADNFNGPVSFTYSGCDANGACDTATVNITVTNVNDAPDAGNDAYSTNEDVPLTIAAAGVLTNDMDVDGNTLSATVVDNPANGTLTLNAAGSFVYTPAANFNGVDRFTYRVCDNGTPQLCDTAEVTITVRPINDTAVAVNDTFTTAEDVPLNIAAPGVLANDTDVEGGPLTATLVQTTTRGTLTLNANGSFIYVPQANYNGSDVFTYSVCDPQGACDTATVSLTITPVNDTPVVNNVNYNATEDVPLVINAPGLTAAGTDIEGGTLTAALVTGPANGSVTINPDGSFTYTPPANFNGTASFTFSLCDGGTPALCDTATATINVAAVNDAPVGVDDTYNVTEDTPLNITAPGVLTNDTDTDGDALTATLITQPANGVLVFRPDGSFTYTPGLNYNGADNFTYRVCDGKGGCDTASVSLNVTAVNDAPAAGDPSYTVVEDVPLTVSTPGLLFSAQDADNDVLTVSLVANPSHGSLVLNPDGSFTYTPAANYNGTDTFTYRICDPSGACDTGTVALSVQPVNDKPLAVDDSYTIAEDNNLTLPAPGPLANDTDPDGDVLTATLLGVPANGRVTLNADGSLVYTPGADFNGTDSFTYLACDGSGNCDTATVNITVTAVNDAPVTGKDVYTITEDNVLNVPAAGVLFNDQDKEGNPLTAVLVTPPASGSLVLNSNGSFVYTPQPDFNGTVSFVYQACDNGTPSLCSTDTVTINVTAANDAPSGVDDSYTLTEDTPLTIAAPGLLANDTDADNNPLTATGIFRQPLHGTVVVNADGSFTYTPAPDYNGVDSFVYNVCDNNTPAACDTAVVTLTITAANDAPRVQDDNFATPEDVPLVLNAPGVLLNDQDPDSDAINLSGIIANPANGSLASNADGSFTYTPAANFQGVDSFVYRACDPSGACDTGTVRIVVSAENDAPIAAADNYTTAEDTPLSVTIANGVLANDNDPDGDNLTATLELAPVNGSLTLSPDGSFTYQPNPNYNGTDLFIYKVCDNAGACVTDTAYLTITPVNDTVIARNDLLNTLEDTNVSGNAGANDNDADGDALTFTLIDSTSHGVMTFNADGSFTYNPDANYNGPDSAAYQVCDPAGACDTAFIIFTVGEENDPPVGTTDTYTVNEDEILTVPAPGVLANDTDPDAGSQLSATLVTPAANGAVILQADGSFTYQPNLNYNGADQFTYNACDANLACVPVVVNITVTPVNDAPTAVSDTILVNEDTPQTGNLLTNDADTDNDAFTASLAVPPNSGTVTISPNGDYTYTPAPNFNGTDVFQYRICDNGTPQLCDTATVAVTVTAQNDVPVVIDDQYQLAEDNVLTVPASTGVLSNDNDADGEILVATLQTPTSGTLTLNSDGSFVYRPNQDFNGSDSFTYQACDLSGACATGTVTLNITPVNDAPIAVNDYFVRSEDTVITFPPSVVLINDIDVDGDPLSGHPIGSLQKGSYVQNPDGTYTYTPAPNYYGLDSIDYEVCDNHGLCDTGRIIINLEPRNDPPEANSDTYVTLEDSVLQVPAVNGVLQNDTDPDGEVLVSILESPSEGSLQLNSDGSFIYRPGNNFNGTDTFTYRACDLGGLCDTASVVIHVQPVNDAPIAVNDYFVRTEDTVITFPPSVALINDIDPDGDPLTGQPIGTLTKGSYTANPDGTYTYHPAANFYGLDSIQYQVCDPGGLCDTGVIVIELLPVNDKPVASDDTYDVLEDDVLTVAPIGVLANDVDADEEPLVASVLTGPQHGALTLNRNGSFTYTPNPDYNGPDSIIYTACDQAGACDTGVVRIIVWPVQDPPQSAADVYTTVEDTPLNIAAPGVLANDSDADGYPLVASLATPPQFGAVTVNPDGSFSYTPAPDFNGTDIFTYQVCDTSGTDQCITDTVTINVTPVNDTPTGNADTYTLSEDTPLVVTAPGVLANDGNTDNDAIQASIQTPPANGQLSLNTDGSFTYTPNPDHNGPDSATYNVCDLQGLCDTAIIRFTITPVNDRPIAVDDYFVRTEDTVLTFPTSVALVNDTDPDGDLLTGHPITNPTHGSYVLNPDGTYTYTPSANFNGIDSVQYEVCDPFGGCDSAWIRIVLTPVNDAPVAQPDDYQTEEDITLSVPAPGVSANDSDVDGDALTVSLLTGTLHGTVTMNADRSFTYIPLPNYNGLDSFVYTICDAGGLCDTSVARITVNTVNDAPIALNNAYALPEDSTLTGNVRDNDSDPDGDPLTVSLVTNTANGALTLNADGSFTYVPNPGFNGTDGASYRVCDAGGLCDTALISFIVTPVNDAPVAVRDSVDVTEDLSSTGNVLTNDSDPEGDALTASLVTAPVNGAVVLNADGSFTYTPNANYTGLDSLIYQACDNGTPSLCDTATLVFNVSAVNDAPIAVRDSVGVTEDVAATGNVLTNDSDPEGNGLTASLVTAPINGTVVLNSDGSFTYTPNGNYNGLDSLSYQVCDNGTPSLCDTAALVFNVSAVNDVPIAVRDSVGVTEDVASTGNVLTNDSDPEGDGLTSSLVTAPINGTVVLNSDGSFTYTPNSNYNGLDSLSYQVCDNGTPSLCDTASLVFNVSAVNDAPIAVRDSVGVTEDVPATGNVLTNDSDPEGDGLTASLVTAAVNGTVVLNADGSFTYTPNANFNGLDSLSYQVCDNGTPSLCDTA
ncbi:Ig-like domain-containing protein, partial [Chitinophaga agrisoli]